MLILSYHMMHMNLSELTLSHNHGIVKYEVSSTI